MNLWLDDVLPAPKGWLHVTTVRDAQKALESGQVDHASLDHDLGPQGMCWSCEQDGEKHHEDCGHCHCHSRHSNGTDLVTWMAATGNWPKHAPEVHSSNPVGSTTMKGLIGRYYDSGEVQKPPETT
jgi:hypothetical protein